MKKISTKLYIYMCTLTAIVLAFVGVTLIANMTLEYYRDFEKTVSSVFDSMQGTANVDSAYEYVMSKYDTLCKNSKKQVYILKDGNIVKSTAEGGSITLSDNLKSVLGGGKSHAPDLSSKTLDYALALEGGITVYVIDSKAELYSSIKSISLLLVQALLLGFLLSLVVGYFLSKRLTRPIKTLTDGAKRMADGEFTKVDVLSKDEIGNLCTVFNELSAQIQSDFDEFERVENSRREFVANVSHELKTPLTAIKSYSETLGTIPVDEDTVKKFLSVIASESDRMSDIVSKLLTLSGLETGNITTVDTDLEAMCKKILTALQFEADSKNITVTLSGRANVVTDADKTETILVNLITNAVKYTEQDGSIDIEIKEGEHPSVRVTDNGIGIAKADLEHIFERFYRTDKARNRKTGGSGLGLAIAKECADSIGAKLTVDSQLHKYTTFTLEF